MFRCSSHALRCPASRTPTPALTPPPSFLLTWLVHGWKTGHALQVQLVAYRGGGHLAIMRIQGDTAGAHDVVTTMRMYAAITLVTMRMQHGTTT